MITLLVVDDDQNTKAMLETWQDSAEIAGKHRTLYAESDAAALTLIAETETIDVVFINVDSPILSGMDLFRKIEKKEARFPRVALTDGADLHIVSAAIADGAVQFMIKPLKFEEWVTTVERVYTQVERRRKDWKDQADFVSLRREVSVAAEMQNRFLPQSFPKYKDMELFAKTIPAKDVGGDFFDVIALDENRTIILVADVAGKSVPAAFYMAISRTLLHTLIEQQASPGTCLAQANTALCSYNIPGMFVSVFCALVDTAKNTLCYSDGGHLPMILHRAGQDIAEQIADSGGPVLGVVAEADYPEATINVHAQDSLLLYSDGVSEAFNESHEQYGMDRLMTCFAKNGGNSSEDIVAAIIQNLSDYAGEADQSDDVTVLCLRVE